MPKTAQIRWDDVTSLLAVIDHGSVAAAARALGVNHATVLRHIADFETRTGVHMFDKTTRGYRISPDRRAIVEAMREAAEALGRVQHMMEAESPDLKSVLRLTTTDTLAQLVLPPILAGYRAESGTEVALLGDNAHVDLARMQAHVTVRPALSLPPEIDGIRAGLLGFAAYAAPGAEEAAWIGLSGPLARAPAGAWLRDQSFVTTAHADSFLVAAAMAAAGAGRAVLPSFVGDTWPGLARLDTAPAIAPIPLWVGAHVDFARSGRIRRLCDFLVRRLARVPSLSED